MNVLIALQVLSQLLRQAQSLGGLILKARQENREITPAELDALAAGDDAVATALRAAIAQARAAGR